MPVINTVAVRPRFSVVIPVHDRADVVGRAVASVLAQTFADLEVVVVDDGSNDDSVTAARAVADGRVRIVRQEHACVAAARTSGLRRSHGAWVVFLDPDDEVAPGWLARFGRLIDSTEAGLVSCAGDQLYTDGTRSTFSPVDVDLSDLDPATSIWSADTLAAMQSSGPTGTVKACFRPGAFAATRERLHRVGAFLGTDPTGVELDPIVSEHVLVDDLPPALLRSPVMNSTVDHVGRGLQPVRADGPVARASQINPFDPVSQVGLAEIGRQLVASVIEDGLQVVHTPESMIVWNEPPVDPCADGDELRLLWALQAIDAVARTPIPDGEMLAQYATIGGVAAARLRDHAEARRLFRLARRAVPDVPKHWVRWIVSCVPPASDRVWEPTTAAMAAPMTEDDLVPDDANLVDAPS
ncbi:hypothetical protein BH10ACT3_BH10ACT3_17210 [soil metagenome]